MWSLAKYLIRTNFILKRRQNFSIFLRESSFPHQSDKERFSSLTRARTSRAKEDRDDDGGGPSASVRPEGERDGASVSSLHGIRVGGRDQKIHRSIGLFQLFRYQFPETLQPKMPFQGHYQGSELQNWLGCAYGMHRGMSIYVLSI